MRDLVIERTERYFSFAIDWNSVRLDRRSKGRQRIISRPVHTYLTLYNIKNIADRDILLFVNDSCIADFRCLFEEDLFLFFAEMDIVVGYFVTDVSESLLNATALNSRVLRCLSGRKSHGNLKLYCQKCARKCRRTSLSINCIRLYSNGQKGKQYYWFMYTGKSSEFYKYFSVRFHDFSRLNFSDCVI